MEVEERRAESVIAPQSQRVPSRRLRYSPNIVEGGFCELLRPKRILGKYGR
jgi:hypothetical protein